jgi:hypothetical protein
LCPSTDILRQCWQKSYLIRMGTVNDLIKAAGRQVLQPKHPPTSNKINFSMASGFSPYDPPYNHPPLLCTLPSGGQVVPGTITYTTSQGPDGRVIYRPFKYVLGCIRRSRPPIRSWSRITSLLSSILAIVSSFSDLQGGVCQACGLASLVSR